MWKGEQLCIFRRIVICGKAPAAGSRPVFQWWRGVVPRPRCSAWSQLPRVEHWWRGVVCENGRSCDPVQEIALFILGSCPRVRQPTNPNKKTPRAKNAKTRAACTCHQHAAPPGRPAQKIVPPHIGDRATALPHAPSSRDARGQCQTTPTHAEDTRGNEHQDPACLQRH